jgi:hypothetical protein
MAVFGRKAEHRFYFLHSQRPTSKTLSNISEASAGPVAAHQFAHNGMRRANIGKS